MRKYDDRQFDADLDSIDTTGVYDLDKAKMQNYVASLRKRLALAEAVCESCNWKYDGGAQLIYDTDALSAWRRAKEEEK